MIKQIIRIKHYWKVIVYYNIDYDLFDIVDKELLKYSLPVEERWDLRSLMLSNKAKGFTISFLKYKTSIIGFNKHNSKADYISSIVHEAEHVKDDMLKYYHVHNSGEPPAYTIGYIVKQLYKVYNTFLCNCKN